MKAEHLVNQKSKILNTPNLWEDFGPIKIYVVCRVGLHFGYLSITYVIHLMKLHTNTHKVPTRIKVAQPIWQKEIVSME